MEYSSSTSFFFRTNYGEISNAFFFPLPMETVLLTSGVLAAGYFTSKNHSRNYASADDCQPFDDVYSAKIIDPLVESDIVKSRLENSNEKNIITNNYKKIRSLMIYNKIRLNEN